MRRRSIGVPIFLALLLCAARSDPGPREGRDGESGSTQQRIDQVMSSAFPPGGPGAAVIATRDGAVMFRKGFGLANVERFSYTSSGYLVAGAILEQVTGKTYEQLARERIFSRIGMKGAHLGKHDDIIPGRVDGYTAREGIIYNRPLSSMTIAYSGGGLMMSVDDLAAWDEALYGDQLLKEPSKQAMWSAGTLSDGRTTGYGLGWYLTRFLGHRVVMHDGSIDGFLGTAMRLPDEHIFVAVLTNSDSPKVGPNVAAKEILAHLLGIPEKRELKMSPETLARYAGDYIRKDGRVWSVIAENGHLLLAPSERKRLKILPETREDFFFSDRSNRFNKVTFKFDEDAAVSALVLTLDTGDEILARRDGFEQQIP